MNPIPLKPLTKFNLSILLCLGVSQPGFSQPGMLDPSFGTTGIVTTNFGNSEDFGGEALVQADDKIVVVGWTYDGVTEDFALARYLPDGQLDGTFGAGGKVTTDFQGKDNVAGRGALQADGKILVVGSSRSGPIGGNDQMMLVRYLPDGTLDSGFGMGGIVSTGIDTVAVSGEAVAVQSDGKIVVVGAYDLFYANFLVLRYLPDGNPDPSFGTNGRILTHHPDFLSIHAYDLVILETGEIVVLGGTLIPKHKLLTVQYLPSGLVDTNFGDNGFILTDFNGGEAFAHSIVLQADGKIIVGGESGNNFGWDFAAARFEFDGNPDHSFGIGGKITTNILEFNDGRSLVVQPDGKIIFAGYTSNPASDYYFAMVRYLANGSLDATFGDDGKVVVNLGDHFFSFGYSAALQTDGKILMAGDTRWDSTYTDFALLRFLSGNEVATFSPPGFEKNFHVFPNPADGIISIQLTQNEFSSLVFRLNNVLGEQMLSFRTSSTSVGESTLEWPVPALPPGLYFLTLEAEGKILETQKVILR